VDAPQPAAGSSSECRVHSTGTAGILDDLGQLIAIEPRRRVDQQAGCVEIEAKIEAKIEAR
jgi:hypothetical protein